MSTSPTNHPVARIGGLLALMGWLVGAGLALPAHAQGAARVIFIQPGGAPPGGGIGCGDRLLAVPIGVAKGQDPLRVALEALLSGNRLAEENGLYNALGRSKLRIQELQVRAPTVIVHLAGTLRLGGACDAPRVRAQLERTVRQFPGLQRLRVTVNGVALEDLLAGDSS